MAKVLFLNGSPIPAKDSKSFAIANKFVEEYKLLNPNDEIINRDLNQIEVSNISSKNFSEYFSNSSKYIDELFSVDKLILNVPMINFGLPTIVKNWIDLICVPNKTFTYKYVKESNETGLVKNIKNVMLINTTGGTTEKYPFADISKQLIDVLDFLGIKNIDVINVQGLKMIPKSDLTPIDIVKDLDSVIKSKAKNF